MMVGNVNVSPLTMASIFAVYASNGVQCDPIALKQVTDVDGNDIKVPSANCHQAVDPEIIQTLAWAMESRRCSSRRRRRRGTVGQWT